MLLEINSTSTNERKWKKEWGGQIIFSHGTSNSRGVATLFRPNLDFKILEKYNDENGRFLLLKCKFEESIYIMVNCYAPTQQHKKDQLDFINFLKSHINKFDTENIIVGGRLQFLY